MCCLGVCYVNHCADWRERISSSFRRADAVSETRRDELRRQVARWAPEATWCEIVHRPTCLVDADARQYPISELAGKRVAAFCGIGNPAGFRHGLESLGGEVVAFRPFPDHHPYRREDLEQLEQWVTGHSADLAVCTRKDQVKIAVDRLGDVRLLALAVEIEVLRGLKELECHLQSVLAEVDCPDG